MSPAMQMTGQHAPYTPRSDAMDRHDYGITKNRKTASTGGGRAWSEDEEAYLLQTRMQKMPYKHIAAYLKKTELACRLHYHQLSHGSNRRKRTTSMSSGSSNSHSPILHASIPSPIHEHGGAPSRSVSPPDSAYSAISPGGIQLPSIMSATASTSTSPRLPTILPKPASMNLAMSSMNGSNSTGTSPTASRGYPTPLHDTHPPNMAPMNSTGYRGGAPNPPARGTTAGPLRLDCSALPPPPSTNGLPAPPGFAASHPVDMARLTAVYNAHRASFWAAVAADYGPGANPLVLEQAWRGTSSATAPGCPPSGSASAAASMGIAAQTPITPVGSPDDQIYSAGVVHHHHAAAHGHGQQQQQHMHHGHGGMGKPDKTRISAILGIDANPRSPSEREMVRRIEEERGAVGVGMA
ncbi:hypothetical protein CHGG_05369 [Chaetomium globosum CBS 148.51]|uniref:Myb-like domain-containing protein n=1 Tax=Chaetomium globosum (strain ATCC 6205 / CBS 148.51 / DSM 1962 / NBRC 6347 / NRRL 1970) TaxID=306901 RepID=Q2H7J6_CHAGB|nr:uncharacterized protein CHGG_05369 [Chaetomium globosum CBS 148.51]EAQ88750.1 hypothetical protein CHGG_05369 [Chaetomium globosum CBS 148.51]